MAWQRQVLLDAVDEQFGEQDQCWNAAHAFEVVDAHVSDFEPLFVVEAVGMRDAVMAVPLGADVLCIMRILDADLSERDELALEVGVSGN
jgi:hypothetical protein